MKSLNESKYGFWSAFTRKAKSVLDDNVAQQSETPGKTRHQVLETSRADQVRFFNGSCDLLWFKKHCSMTHACI